MITGVGQPSPAPAPQGFAGKQANNDAAPARESEEAAQQTQTAEAIQPAAQSDAGGQLASALLDGQLTPEEEREVQELKRIDAETRAHEQAHKAAGGPVTGAISYEYVTGPDGRQYAVGGEVDIDVSPVSGNPEATIRKMDIVIRAALAPAQPSPQDFAVARQAQQIRLQAQNEKRQQEQAEREDGNKSPLEALAQTTAETTPDSGFLQAIEAFADTEQLTRSQRGILLSSSA